MPFSFHTMFNLVLAASLFIVAFTFIVIFRLLKRKHPFRDGCVCAVLFFAILVGLRYAGRGLGGRFLNDAFYMPGMFVYMAFLSTLFIFIFARFVYLDRRFQLGAIAVLTIVMFCVGIYDAQTFDVKTITIDSEKIGKSYDIVFFSDVHVGSESPAYLGKLVARINSMGPDIVLIGGDLVDGRDITKEDLEPLDDILAPVFMVYGNHDSMVGSIDLGDSVEILDDGLVDFDGLELIGVNYRQHRENNVGDALDALPMNSSKFRLLLIHAPVGIGEAAERDIDLILSGHTHGGQIFPYHLVHQYDFGYIYGLYSIKGAELYVTSGAGVWGPNFRFGSRNEIIRVILMPDS